MEKSNKTHELIDVNTVSLELYQRPINYLFIKDKVENFKRDLLTTIYVSRRDGKNYVMDGQHRILIAKKVGITHIDADVYHGLTIQEEAILFNEFNGGNKEKKPLHKEDIFRAEIVSENEASLDIKKIIESFGFKFGRGMGTNTILSIDFVKKVYEKDGAGHLEKVMKILSKTWDGDEASLVRNMILGVSEFIKVYSSDPNYSDEKFIKQLSKVEPSVIIREMKSDVSTNVIKIRILNTMFKYYNKNLSKKLANKHFALTEG